MHATTPDPPTLSRTSATSQNCAALVNQLIRQPPNPELGENARTDTQALARLELFPTTSEQPPTGRRAQTYTLLPMATAERVKQRLIDTVHQQLDELDQHAHSADVADEHPTAI